MPIRINPKVAHQKARVAGLTRVGADPAVIEAARFDLHEARGEAFTDRLRLTAAARARLARRILQGGGDDAP